MKTKIFIKKLLVTLSIVLIAVMALVIAGCTNNKKDEPTTTESVQTTEKPSVIHKGEGKNAFVFIVLLFYNAYLCAYLYLFVNL